MNAKDIIYKFDELYEQYEFEKKLLDLAYNFQIKLKHLRNVADLEDEMNILISTLNDEYIDKGHRFIIRGYHYPQIFRFSHKLGIEREHPPKDPWSWYRRFY